MAKQRLKQLDGIRAIAVLLVVFYHLNIYGAAIPGYNLLIGNGGIIGVTTFFILSGFLMTGFYLGNVEKIRPSYITFYKARFIRIVPLYLLSTITFFLLRDYILIKHEVDDWVDLVKGLFFWENNLFGLNPVLWTLKVEIIFYLIFPLLGKWLLSYSQKNKLYMMFLIPLTMVLVSLAVRYLNLSEFNSFFANLDGLAIGIVNGIIYNNYGHKIARIFQGKEILSLLVFLSLLFISLNVSHSIFIFPLILSFLLGAIFLLVLFLKSESFIYKFLGNNIFFYVALLSYSIYIWHFNLYYIIAKPWINNFSYPVYISSILSALVGIILTLIFSYFTYFYIEKPFIDLKHKFR